MTWATLVFHYRYLSIRGLQLDVCLHTYIKLASLQRLYCLPRVINTYDHISCEVLLRHHRLSYKHRWYCHRSIHISGKHDLCL